MLEPITVNPGRLSQFGSAQGATFCLVTNAEIEPVLSVNRDSEYSDYLTLTIGPEDQFEELLADRIPEQAHVLVISPYSFFESPSPDALGSRRKLLAMACNSTPTSIDVIRHFLTVIEQTSAEEQAALSDRFFEIAESAEYLEYVDERHGTRAVLQHLGDRLVWNQQAGPLEWGEQQIAPSGEISVLPAEITEFDERLSLPLEGEIAFRGTPILHSGTPSFMRSDQARIHEQLTPMERHGVVARVEAGKIVDLRPHRPEGASVAKMLEAMIEVDSRYRHVWEIGHAINTSLVLLAGNHAMNEVYGGSNGCLHWGIGLTPYTQYHLDVIAPDTAVYTDAGEVVLRGHGGDGQIEAESRGRR